MIRGLVSLQDVHFSYRTEDGDAVPVLKGVNLEIHAGELIAIQGPSGSGKSTLLYIIGCLLSTYTGKVEIGGLDISKLSDEQSAILRNRHVGFVFQQFHLLPKATVLENILLPSHYPSEYPIKRDLEARAIKIAEDLGLSERLGHFPKQLSGGQQQRVSIARALLNHTQIILADEPTGSLDTINSQQTMEILKAASAAGRTVVVITHDSDVARQCDRVVHFRDGLIQDIVEYKAPLTPEFKDEVESTSDLFSDVFAKQKLEAPKTRRDLVLRYFRLARTLFPLALGSLAQNKSRSVLTMLGIVIGVAAVLSMVTVGDFTKRKILDSYAEMGVNTVAFYGYPNWELRATDKVSTVFQSFDRERDLDPIQDVFPEVVMQTPVLSTWDGKVGYGGKVVDTDVTIYGTSNDGFALANRAIALGSGFSPFHIEYRSAVCVIGYDLYQRLFQNVSPIGQIVSVTRRENSYGCRVLGVLAPQTSNKEWIKPNSQIYLPYTFFQSVNNPWDSRIRQILLRIKTGADIELTGKKMKAFFEMKYGKSGRFVVGSDSVLIAQMNRFLSLFTVLLAAIALVSLAVGGIGITNMMLVSVSERFKEIGIRKAFGATNFSIRVQYLVESVLLCCIAGLVGLVIGFVLYEGAIYGATKLVSRLEFEWTVDLVAVGLSVAAVLIVGVVSGLTPALRAEKLQVIEALRSE